MQLPFCLSQREQIFQHVVLGLSVVVLSCELTQSLLPAFFEGALAVCRFDSPSLSVTPGIACGAEASFTRCLS